MSSENRQHGVPLLNKIRQSQEPPWPSPGYAWYVVGVLTLAYIVSYIDRQILTLMIEPIRHDLGISDTQVSLLTGLAFVLLFAVASIPIGRMADHRNRRLIITVGIIFWSMMTAACGLARNFSQLFMARAGVGVGEATLTPAAYSMISDYFPPQRLGRAIGIYMAGVPVGSGFALLAGAAVISLVSRIPQLELPFIGVISSWQLAFLIVGLPGILIAALMITVKEPFRRGRLHRRDRGATADNQGIPLSETVDFLKTHMAIYLPMFGGFAIVAMVMNAVMIWTPTVYIRTWGWSASSIGYVFGACLLIFGTTGAISGGCAVDFLSRRGHPDAALRITILLLILMWPTAALMPLMPDPALSVALLALLTALLFAFGAVVPTAFQLVTPNELRAQVTAISILVVNVVGMGLGPTAVALITDYGFADEQALRFSVSIVAAVFTPLGLLSFWSGLKPYQAEMHQRQI